MPSAEHVGRDDGAAVALKDHDLVIQREQKLSPSTKVPHSAHGCMNVIRAEDELDTARMRAGHEGRDHAHCDQPGDELLASEGPGHASHFGAESAKAEG